MLYLNSVTAMLPTPFILYLTLTSVVFEFEDYAKGRRAIDNLTLTSVVFEFDLNCRFGVTIEFNFNKCCIWITPKVATMENPKLFNFNKCCIWIG